MDIFCKSAEDALLYLKKYSYSSKNLLFAIINYMKRIILASTSPRRKELMEKIGLKFEVVRSDYEEDMTIKLKPKELAKYLSLGKANSVAKKYKNALIISADTFVTFKDNVLGKPHTPEQTKKTLKMLSGKSHLVITGFTIIDTASQKRISKAVVTKVYFKKISNEEINTYAKSSEPLDKAGAYAIQGLGSVLIEKIEGDFFNVVGLPISALVTELKKFGIKVL